MKNKIFEKIWALSIFLNKNTWEILDKESRKQKASTLLGL